MIADRKQAQTSKRETDEKPQRDPGPKTGRTSGSKARSVSTASERWDRSGATCPTKAKNGTRRSQSRPDVKDAVSTGTTSVSSSIRRAEPLSAGLFYRGQRTRPSPGRPKGFAKAIANVRAVPAGNPLATPGGHRPLVLER